MVVVAWARTLASVPQVGRELTVVLRYAHSLAISTRCASPPKRARAGLASLVSLFAHRLCAIKASAITAAVARCRIHVHVLLVGLTVTGTYLQHDIAVHAYTPVLFVCYPSDPESSVILPLIVALHHICMLTSALSSIPPSHLLSILSLFL